jgi:phenylacetate-CoA ligase
LPTTNSDQAWNGRHMRATETRSGEATIMTTKPLASEPEKQERRQLIEELRGARSEDLVEFGRQAIVPAFLRAYACVPAYRQIVDRHGGLRDAADVMTIPQFLQVAPLLDKHNTFAAYPIRELCLNGNLDSVRSILTSSGHSGVHSFGVNTVTNIEHSAKSIDILLQYFIGADEHSTLLINCLPMGVRFNTAAAVVAETSVHDGMVYALIKRFSADFEQIVLFGENSFIKKIIEDGAESHGIDWRKIRIHLCIGEETAAENYRSYIGELIGIKEFPDPNGQIIISSWGAGELGLNIFHETHETILIRRLAHRDAALRVALFGPAARHFCPMFFVYYPPRCYVEAPGQGDEPGELAITMLSEDLKIQLPRFRPGDIGQILTYRGVVSTLARFGYAIEPDLKLPFVAVFGRGSRLETRQGPLYPEAVKEAIYADPSLAQLFTGNFRLVSDDDLGQALFQLRPDKMANGDAADRLLSQLALYSDARPRITILPYGCFPYSMNLDYERKFQYL